MDASRMVYLHILAMADRTIQPKLSVMRLGIGYELMSKRRKIPKTSTKLYNGILVG